jgi:hypothetical protein
VKCNDICPKLPVSVLVGDHWIDGQIGSYRLGHTCGKDNWTGHVNVKFTDDKDDDDKIVIRVPAALIDSHLRERKETP